MRSRALLLTQPRKLEWIHDLLSAPGPDELLLETCCTAISIGTELPTYQGISRHFQHTFPCMTGYESLGRVMAKGKDTNFNMGERIVAFYGHRSHALVKSHQAIGVPEGISNQIALLSILSCDVAKGIRKLEPDPHEPIVVSGAGAIGLLSLFVLKAYGAQHVDIIEPLAERRQLASILGARNTYPVPHTSDAYTYALECSGHNSAFQNLQRLLKPDSTMCILADGHLEPFTLLPEFHSKELKIVGSSDGWDYAQHAQWFFGLRDVDTLEKLFDLRIQAEQLAQTFEAMAQGKINPVKVLVAFAA